LSGDSGFQWMVAVETVLAVGRAVPVADPEAAAAPTLNDAEPPMGDCPAFIEPVESGGLESAA
jgi:hypothetical protein